MEREQKHDSEIAGLKKRIEERLRDLDSHKPTQAAKQNVADSADAVIGRGTGNDDRDNFERLLREGSKGSRAKGAGQNNGCIPLLLIFSFIISLALPLFWVVFVLLLLGVLTSSAREWMG
ncbi:MAG: hypothetical protein NTV57_15445 [Cyanobacteria bacterium]|nr:hypothetical protein [Cyanobacteriota bacterium]